MFDHTLDVLAFTLPRSDYSTELVYHLISRCEARQIGGPLSAEFREGEGSNSGLFEAAGWPRVLISLFVCLSDFLFYFVLQVTRCHPRKFLPSTISSYILVLLKLVDGYVLMTITAGNVLSYSQHQFNDEASLYIFTH